MKKENAKEIETINGLLESLKTIDKMVLLEITDKYPFIEEEYNRLDMINLPSEEASRQVKRIAKGLEYDKVKDAYITVHGREFMERLKEIAINGSSKATESYVEIYKNMVRKIEPTESTTISELTELYNQVCKEPGKEPEREPEPKEEKQSEPKLEVDKEFKTAQKRYEKIITIIKQIIKARKSVYIWGEAGTGKSTIGRQIAEELNLRLYNYCSNSDIYDYKGYTDETNQYHYALIELWFKNGGVLLLDELDNCQANVLVALNNYLESGTTKIMLSNGEIITRNKNCYVVATGNTDGLGATTHYHSRDRLDKSVLSRLGVIELNETEYIIRTILGELYDRVIEIHYNNIVDPINIRTAKQYKTLIDEYGIDWLITATQKYKYRV